MDEVDEMTELSVHSPGKSSVSPFERSREFPIDESIALVLVIYEKSALIAL